MKQLLLALSLALAIIAPFTSRADPVDGITIAPEVDAAYDREATYGRWRDADNDGLNTRDEVLAMESLVPVTLDDQGRKVISGLWFDPYTGVIFVDPGDIDIDHLVPPWDKDKRRQYANGLDSPGQLIGVDNGTSQVLSFRRSRARSREDRT